MTHDIKALNPDDADQVARCFRVFSFLRPHLNLALFKERLAAQVEEGYRIVYIEHDGEVVAAAGYRVAHFLAWGKVLYLDDLITDPEQTRRGLGGALMDWLIAEGRTLGCDELHLDTGYQRQDAHRLYLNKGLSLVCHHLGVELK